MRKLTCHEGRETPPIMPTAMSVRVQNKPMKNTNRLAKPRYKTRADGCFAVSERTPKKAAD